jgi:hypothetical protein
MHSSSRAGGFAALYQAAAYLAGMIFFLALVNYPALSDPLEKVALLQTHQSALQLITFIIYVLFGMALIVLNRAWHQRLRETAPLLMDTAAAFGLVWATVVIAAGMIFNIGMETVVGIYPDDPERAATIWATVSVVFEGLGGGNEILGGVWTLLISIAAMKSRAVAPGWNYLGLVVGAAGIASALPPLAEIAAGIFGLGQLIWFAGTGIVLLRTAKTSS